MKRISEALLIIGIETLKEFSQLLVRLFYGWKKYHINPETGRPNQCTATVRDCKYAENNLIPEHYDSKEEAQAAYEQSMNREEGQTSSLSKTKSKSKRKINFGTHATH